MKRILGRTLGFVDVRNTLDASPVYKYMFILVLPETRKRSVKARCSGINYLNCAELNSPTWLAVRNPLSRLIFGLMPGDVYAPYVVLKVATGRSENEEPSYGRIRVVS